MRRRLIAFVVILLTTSVLSVSLNASAAVPTIESGFSPDGSAELLILSAISSAQKSIRVAAYSFTSPVIVNALIGAKKRGVDVAVVADYKQTVQNGTKDNGKQALDRLIKANVKVKTLANQQTQHSKYMVIDKLHTQTGSYNYSASAALYNHENVIVVRNDRRLAQAYLDNWQTLYKVAKPYKPKS